MIMTKFWETRLLRLFVLTAFFSFVFHAPFIAQAAPPALTSFTSPTANGTYGVNDTIQICADYDKDLLNPSTMSVTLDTGVTIELRGPIADSVGGTMSADVSQFSNHAGFVQGHIKGALKLPNGKYLIWGSATDIDGNGNADYIARINADGSLDTSFAQLNLNNSVFSVGVQSDGKIIIGGSFTQFNGVNEGYIRLARLNTDGTLDTSFAQHSVSATVEVITVQDDDKILIGGNFNNFDGVSNLDRIARLNADGTLDTTFNPVSFNNATHAITVQPDGKILVGGAFHTYNGNSAYDRLVRLNPDGSQDVNFSNNFPADTASDITEIGIQSDGKIVIAGDITDFDGQTNLDNIARLNPDGSRDTSFAGTISSDVNAIYLEDNGKIIVSEISNPHLSRLESNGSVDPGFIMPDSLVGNKQIYTVFPDGDKLFIGGNFNDLGGHTDQDKFGHISGDNNAPGTASNQICGEYIVGANENSADLTITAINSENVTDLEGNTQTTDTIPSGNNLADNSDIAINTIVTAPGGLDTDLSLWLKANGSVYSSGTTQATNGQTIDTWVDSSNSDNNALEDTAIGAGSKPLFTANGINFNPTIDMNASDDYFKLTQNVYPGGSQNATAYMVTHPNNGGGVFVQESNNGNGATPIFKATGHVLLSPASQVNGQGNSSGLPKIDAYTQTSSNTVSTYGNGAQINSATLSATPYANLTGDNYIGARVHGSPSNYQGELSEVIVYNSAHDSTERQKVSSYLALKYGITLDPSISAYILSDGTSVWSDTSHWNDVFGLAKDLTSTLNQKISHSVNQDGIVTLSLSDDFISPNNSHTGIIPDKKALVVGNNDGQATWTTSDAPNGYQILTRQWLAQNNGITGTYISFNVENPNFDVPDTLKGDSYYLVIDTAGDGFQNDTPLILVNNSGNLWSRVQNLANGAHFTLATEQLDPPTAPDMQANSDSGLSNTDNITNNNQPVFDVQCTAAGDIITLYSDNPNPNTVIGTHTCSGVGVEGMQPDNPLPDGNYNIDYSIKKANADESPHSTSLAVVIDTTDPSGTVITSPTDNSSTGDTTPTFSGTGEAGSSVEVKDENGDTVCSATVDAGGNWTCEATNQIAEGSHTFSTETTDAAGNGPISGNSITTNIDTTPPATPNNAPDMTDSTDTGNDNQDNITSNTKPDFTVSCESNGDTVTLYVDGAPNGTATCSGGSATITPIVALAEGNHDVSYTEMDPAGNESGASPTLSINIDTTAPETPNANTSPNPAKDGTNVSTTVSGVAAGNSVSIPGMNCSPNPSTGADVICTGTIGQNGLDGVDTTVTVTDPAGNTNTGADSGLVVDNTLPSIDVFTADLSGSNPVLTFSGSDNVAVDHYEIQYDGAGPFSTVTSPLTTTFNTTDVHSATLKAIDTAGNEITKTIHWPPQIVINAPTVLSNGPITDTSFTITSPSGADITITAIAGGTGFTNCTGAGGDTTSPYASPVTCDGGTISNTGDLEITASDGVGTGNALQHYVVDNSDPSITITPNTTVDNQSITDTKIIVTDDNGINANDVGVDTTNTTVSYSNFSCTQITNTKVSCSISIDGQTEPTQNLVVVASDQAGNNATASQNGYRVDTIAPAPPTINQPTDGLVTTNKTPAVTGTAEANSAVSIYANGTLLGVTMADATGNYSFNIPAPGLNEGSNSITAKATDDLGNTSPASPEVSVTVDTTPPTTPNNAPDMTDSTDTGNDNQDNITSNTKPDFTVSCESNGDTVTLYVDGAPNGTATCSGGSATITPIVDLGEGEHNITYMETDTVGNESGQSPVVAITVDTTAPSASVITSPIDGSEISDTTPTFSGTGEAGSLVEVKDENGNTVCSATVDAGGNWTCEATNQIAEGSHTFSTKTTDAAGNGPISGAAININLSPGDGDNIDDEIEDQAPNGDGNGDGMPDKEQANVATQHNQQNGSYTTIAVAGDCGAITGYNILQEEGFATQDDQHFYPLGLNDFTINCGAPGATAKVVIYYDKKYKSKDWKYRKYHIGNQAYSDITGQVEFATTKVHGKTVTTISYSIVDGGPLDADGVANGIIHDPAGPAIRIDRGNSSIGNTIWLDKNANGKQDEGEPGLENIRVKLIWYGPNGKYDHGKKDDKVWRTDTNHNGHYKFENLPKGKYKVIVKKEDVAKYVQTYDPDSKMDGKDTVHLRKKQNYTKADFGYTTEEWKLARTGDNNLLWLVGFMSILGIGIMLNQRQKNKIGL